MMIQPNGMITAKPGPQKWCNQTSDRKGSKSPALKRAVKVLEISVENESDCKEPKIRLL